MSHPKRLPVSLCNDCAFRGRGRLERSVALAHGGQATGVVVSGQGERRKLYCPACQGPNTRLAKQTGKQEDAK